MGVCKRCGRCEAIGLLPLDVTVEINCDVVLPFLSVVVDGQPDQAMKEKRPILSACYNPKYRFARSPERETGKRTPNPEGIESCSACSRKLVCFRGGEKTTLSTTFFFCSSRQDWFRSTAFPAELRQHELTGGAVVVGFPLVLGILLTVHMQRNCNPRCRKRERRVDD